jgi:hypothetical protein
MIEMGKPVSVQERHDIHYAKYPGRKPNDTL